MGFTLIDPGRFQNGTQDFSAQIAAFKKDGVEIVTGVVIPPDAKTFLTQAKQQGFKPKVITLGKALLFPGAIEALGDLGYGLTHRGLVEPVAPVHVVADQAERQGAGRGLRGRHQEAVDAADRLRPRAVRGGGRRAEAQQERSAPRTCATRWRRPNWPPSSARSSGAAKARSRTSARRRWCWASGARARSTRCELTIVNNAGGEEHPDRRHAQADRLSPEPWSRSGAAAPRQDTPCPCPCSPCTPSASPTAR